MIDWWGLLRNSLWVMGLAVVLGAVSMANYEAQRARLRLGNKLRETGFQLWFSIGIVLICTGLALGGRAWWEYAIWLLLAVAFGANVARLGWRRRA